MNAQKYNAFGLSPLAMEMLASIHAAGGTAKHEHDADSPEAKAMEELITASAVTQNPDGSVTVTAQGVRWLTQDASLKASEISADGRYADNARVNGEGRDDGTWKRSSRKDNVTGMVVQGWENNSGSFVSDSTMASWEKNGHVAKFSASDPSAVCADIHYHGTDAQRAAFGTPKARDEKPGGAWWDKCVAKISGSGSAGRPALTYGADVFAAVDADASLKACEKVCMLYAVAGSLERTEVTFDVIDSLLAKGLVEPAGDRKTYRASDVAARKYGAEWTKQDANTMRAEIGDVVMYVRMAGAMDGPAGSYVWDVHSSTSDKNGKAHDIASAKSAAESAARFLGAKFDAGAVEWKAADATSENRSPYWSPGEKTYLTGEGSVTIKSVVRPGDTWTKRDGVLWLDHLYLVNREKDGKELRLWMSAGSAQAKYVDPQATTQITSTERTVLVRMNSDGSGVPAPGDEVVYRTLAQKGLIEMDESGAYHVTSAGRNALATGGVGSVVPTNAIGATATKFADSGLASTASTIAQKLSSLPTGAKLDSAINDARGLLSQARSSLARKSTPQLKSAIDKANRLLSQAAQEEGRDAATSAFSAVQEIENAARFSSVSQSSSAPIKAAAPKIPTGEYLAVFDEATNTYTIKDVPIFAEHKVPGAKFRIGAKWMRAAVQKAQDRATADKYMAPLHVRHHGDAEGTRRAGFVMPTEVRRSLYEGHPTDVLYADLVGITPDVYEDIKARRLPYRSVEINKIDVPEISSLALLEDEVPYFRLPMLGVGEEVASSGSPHANTPQVAASARRIRASACMTPCVAYAESVRRGRATYLYSEANMMRLTLAANVSRKYAAWVKGPGNIQSLPMSATGGKVSASIEGSDSSWKWDSVSSSGQIKSGRASSEADAKAQAEGAAKGMGANFSQSPNGGSTMRKRYDEMTDEEKEKTVQAKMRQLRMADDDEKDEEKLRAKAESAIRLAEGNDVCPTCGKTEDECECPDDAAAMADVLQPDTELEEGAKAGKGTLGGQPGSGEEMARQFAAMNRNFAALVAGQKRMLKMMSKAYDMPDDEEEEEEAEGVKAADAPTDEEEEGPVDLKASARMAARLSTVEGKLAKAEASAKIDKAVRYAMRELDGYSVGDPADVEKRVRSGAMKYGVAWINEYLADVKRLAPKAPTDDGIDDTGERVGDLPDEVLAYRAGGPEKLERAVRHYSEWKQLKLHGHGTFAKDDSPKRYIDTQMQYSAVDGNGVARA